jgi:hypothetical protein
MEAGRYEAADPVLARGGVPPQCVRARGNSAPVPAQRAALFHSQFYGKRQGGLWAEAIFLWWFPLFCAAEKTEKSGKLCKDCSAISSWTLG